MSFAGNLKRALADAVVPSALLVTRGRGDAKRIALTFDDGPDALTSEYLDLLDRLDVRATFFVVGSAAAARRDDLLEMVRRGHQVAGHGYSHKHFTRLGAAELRDELERTTRVLPLDAGRPIVRPPGGLTSLGSLARVARAGYTTVLWSMDSLDARTRSPAEVAAQVAPGRVAPGEIVLLHEGQRWTLDALPPMVAALRATGWSFATVEELR